MELTMESSMDLVVDTKDQLVVDEWNFADSKLTNWLMGLGCGFCFCFLMAHLIFWIVR